MVTEKLLKQLFVCSEKVTVLVERFTFYGFSSFLPLPFSIICIKKCAFKLCSICNCFDTCKLSPHLFKIKTSNANKLH